MKRNLRHHRRIPTHLPATVEIPGAEMPGNAMPGNELSRSETPGVETLQADIANLSRTGVMLECDRQTLEILHPKSAANSAPTQAKISFSFSCETTGTVKVECVCSIVYARRLSRDVFHVGLAFKNLDTNLIPSLEQYIAAHRES